MHVHYLGVVGDDLAQQEGGQRKEEDGEQPRASRSWEVVTYHGSFFILRQFVVRSTTRKRPCGLDKKTT